jgi:hypothetical protein
MKFNPLLCIVVVQQFSVVVKGSILTKLPKCDGCHCLTSGDDDTCPALPTIDQNAVSTYKALTLENPVSIRCNPFSSASCVEPLESGEACVAELIPPTKGDDVLTTGDDVIGGASRSDHTCPTGYSYR